MSSPSQRRTSTLGNVISPPASGSHSAMPSPSQHWVHSLQCQAPASVGCTFCNAKPRPASGAHTLQCQAPASVGCTLCNAKPRPASGALSLQCQAPVSVGCTLSAMPSPGQRRVHILQCQAPASVGYTLCSAKPRPASGAHSAIPSPGQRRVPRLCNAKPSPSQRWMYTTCNVGLATPHTAKALAIGSGMADRAAKLQVHCAVHMCRQAGHPGPSEVEGAATPLPHSIDPLHNTPKTITEGLWSVSYL